MKRITKTANSFDGYELAKACAEKLAEKLALDTVILDLSGISDFADFFVVATAQNSTHLISLADEIDILLQNKSVGAYHIEGEAKSSWILVDVFSVVVHILLPEARAFYDIESYWGEASVERVA